METLTDRIRFKAREVGLTYTFMADKLGISEAAVSKWFKSGKVDKDHLPGLARMFGCSIDYLMTGMDSLVVPSSGGLIVSAVPIIAIADAARFVDGAITESEIMSKVPVNAASAGSFAFTVQGDTMVNPSGLPSYPPGVVCVCDPEVAPESGRRVVVDLPGSGPTFKELLVDSGVSYLKPLNPRYPVVQLPDDARILGVVTKAIFEE